jgi:hypothetical protein
VNTIANEASLSRLLARMARLTPATPRRWGTLTPAEMLCHLGDSGESVLGVRVPPGPKASGRPNRLVKWLAVYSPMPWPKGVETRPGVNPHKEGTRPGVFEQDRTRVVEALRALARAPEGSLSPAHFRFGPMALRDWQCWAYRHVDHHLRQFGL